MMSMGDAMGAMGGNPDANFLTKDDVNALKNYVQAPSAANMADSTVLIHCTHSNLQARFFELRLDKHMTVESIKIKLSFHCGTSPSSMMLQLLDESGSMVAMMNDDSRKFGFYSPMHGYTIHIVDTDPTSSSAGGWLEDTSLVEKYKMSDDKYDKLENTYRKFKAKKLAADPEWTLEKEMAIKRGVEYVPPPKPVSDPEHQKEAADTIKVGARCSVEPGDRRGEVLFVGAGLEGLPLGYWVGIKYDEPVGKNDGSVKGVRYFTCPPGYGAFLRPEKVKTGDYPELDMFGSDDEI